MPLDPESGTTVQPLPSMPRHFLAFYEKLLYLLVLTTYDLKLEDDTFFNHATPHGTAVARHLKKTTMVTNVPPGPERLRELGVGILNHHGRVLRRMPSAPWVHAMISYMHVGFDSGQRFGALKN